MTREWSGLPMSSVAASSRLQATIRWSAPPTRATHTTWLPGSNNQAVLTVSAVSGVAVSVIWMAWSSCVAACWQLMNRGGSNIFRPRARFSSLCSLTLISRAQTEIVWMKFPVLRIQIYLIEEEQSCSAAWRGLSNLGEIPFVICDLLREVVFKF